MCCGGFVVKQTPACPKGVVPVTQGFRRFVCPYQRVTIDQAATMQATIGAATQLFAPSRHRPEMDGESSHLTTRTRPADSGCDDDEHDVVAASRLMNAGMESIASFCAEDAEDKRGEPSASSFSSLPSSSARLFDLRRHGSLPLKKRRFLPPIATGCAEKDGHWASSSTNDLQGGASFLQGCQRHSQNIDDFDSARCMGTTLPPAPLTKADDEKMSLLALIAASCSTLQCTTDGGCGSAGSKTANYFPAAAAAAAAAVPVTPIPSRPLISDSLSSISMPTDEPKEDTDAVASAAMAIAFLSLPRSTSRDDAKRVSSATTTTMCVTPVHQHSIVSPLSTPVAWASFQGTATGAAMLQEPSASLSATSTSIIERGTHVPNAVDNDRVRRCSPATLATRVDCANKYGHTTIVKGRLYSSPGKRPTSPSAMSSSSSSSSQSSSKANPTSTVAKRMHHPRLSNPLPGGCHGRTSRNNSFCRRQPCFNESNYCKMHYQQHQKAGGIDTAVCPVVATKGSARKPTPSTRRQGQNLAHAPPHTERPPAVSPASIEGVANSTKKSPASHSLPFVDQALAVPNIMHQDKRFTGAVGEVRCLATTTRGRACAYVAVADCGGRGRSSRYCHLHVDYDANPPPRRNKSSLGEDSPSATASHSKSSLGGSGNDVSPTAAAAGDGTSSGRSMELLSMISTDQWYQKRVILSTGPLLSCSGRVERWGNGWVGVRMDVVNSIPSRGQRPMAGDGSGIGLQSNNKTNKIGGTMHNRRSFELVLHPDQDWHDGK